MVRTFSVTRKKVPCVNFTTGEKRLVKYFSDAITEHFSMSEELAKAIGTVVVQALTENAKNPETTDSLGGDEFMSGDDDFDLGEDDEFDLGDSELPESARDAGEVEEAEGPKNAPDLSSDFAELKRTVSNHSENMFSQRYKEIKNFLTLGVTED